MKVFIAGDYCPQARVASIIEQEDYASVFSEVREITSNTDYSIINLECPVVTSNSKPIEKCGPNLRCTPQGVKALKWAGFNCVTLANNHYLDYGDDGAKDTLTILNEENIDYVGGGMNLEEASRVFYKDIAGKRLALINCCEHEFSIATENSAGSNPLNPIKQYYSIKQARKNADCVMVIIHGGHEHFQLPSLRMVETYRFFIDAGADAVVNHHQHCYSGYEVYHGKPIFYGLGNFCFDNDTLQDDMWTKGYAVVFDFTNDEPAFELYPYRQCASRPRIEMLQLDAFDTKLRDLNATISNPEKMMDALNKYYSGCASEYSNIFEPFYNRYFFGAKRRGWLPSFISKARKLRSSDYVLCEAHRDKLKFWFEMHNK